MLLVDCRTTAVKEERGAFHRPMSSSLQYRATLHYNALQEWCICDLSDQSTAKISGRVMSCKQVQLV